MNSPRWSALALLLLGYAMALHAGQPSLATLFPMALLAVAGAAVQAHRAGLVRRLGHGLFVVTALGLALHLWPGFNSASIMPEGASSPGAQPFITHLNLDKPLIGLWLLLACPWLFQRPIHSSWRRSLSIALGTSTLCLTLACVMGVTAWAPKWPDYAWLWLANNLLLVVITEELLFRGYLQGALQSALQHRCHNRALGRILPIAITALLFGLAHAGGGWAWVMLAGLAGVGYGLAWNQGGPWAAIGAHFLLNLVHFSLFAYPMLNR